MAPRMTSGFPKNPLAPNGKSEHRSQAGSPGLQKEKIRQPKKNRELDLEEEIKSSSENQGQEIHGE
jgi:hypothetical protein